jgi:ABC-type polysaccharide/polyol phosphate export permease
MTTSRKSRPAAGGWTGYAPLDAASTVQLQAAVNDIREGLRRWRSWTYLAVEAVKNRYRRTVLGPWWLTLQMAVYVVGLAIIFGQLLHTGLRNFLPYVTVGFIAYSLLAGLTRAGAEVFVTSSSTMKSTPQPLSSLVLRDVAIEFIQFGHNVALFVPFVVFGLVPLSPKMIIAVPILLVIAANGFFLGLWLGIAAARFRDVQPFVMSILQVLIFFTPVFYKQTNLTPAARNALLAWNPFTYLLDAFRAPLIGATLQQSYFIGTVLVTLINAALGLVLFTRTRSRLPYWVA